MWFMYKLEDQMVNWPKHMHKVFAKNKKMHKQTYQQLKVQEQQYKHPLMLPDQLSA